MLRQLLSVPKDPMHDDGAASGDTSLAMLSNVSASTLPFASSSVSGTSELFSSTFAMLSDAGPPIPDQWEKANAINNGYFYEGATLSDEFGRFLEGHYEHHIDNRFDAPPRMPFIGYHPHHHQAIPNGSIVVDVEAYRRPPLMPPQMAPLVPMQVQQPPVVQLPPQQQQVQSVVQNGNNSSTPPSAIMNDGPGRNYLDQMATTGTIPPPPGPEGGAKPGVLATGSDGLSPICPYCDRFISHYKGNIRRHINQCGKTGGKRMKAKRRKLLPGETEMPWNGAVKQEMTLYEHINGNMYHQQPPPHYPEPHLPSMNQMPPPMAESTPKKEPEVPDDPYLCPHCDFLTVYKGNMKRHLNTCHQMDGEKGSDVRLDDMKASVQGVAQEELHAKLTAHKQNSTRGRKPKVKKTEMNQGQNGSFLHSPGGGDSSLGSAGSSTSPLSSDHYPSF